MKESPNQSISRGIQLLRMVAQSPDGLTVQEIADLLEVSRPTAHNIATTLLHETFLTKLNKPVRYCIGPGPSRIANQAQLQQRQQQAKDLIRDNSLKHPGTGWVYAETGEDEMRIIWRSDFKRPEVIERVDREVTHPYDAATALLFHAFADETRVEALRRRYPFHEFALSIWNSREAFQDCLNEIQKKGCVTKAWSTRRELGALAAPIFNQEKVFIGSIGAFFPAESKQTLDKALLNTVKESAHKLSNV